MEQRNSAGFQRPRRIRPFLRRPAGCSKAKHNRWSRRKITSNYKLRIMNYELKALRHSLLLGFLLSTLPLGAQSAYHGGKGDGYASALLVLRQGIEEYKNEPFIGVYPNPVYAGQALQISMSSHEKMELEVFDLEGRK